ncbi:VPDSG-CTERM sorting domain-containing protein [Pelagicoccus sp. NFK12]|uniref:VPDSG-CTERM sorting domain-containing protein n=1 Tax=Pelagicoccus enzymogenes TaxID=2773457 RepID=A0A927F9D4_9BACT|nr:VPDSG-CTERM sorting domain-containing protein [Pelagicoccus enzymogenes]MBD5779646.1 VPDSG-CTERM sorting domain-containing protein [Pelagicoccus enzymogenes]
MNTAVTRTAKLCLLFALATSTSYSLKALTINDVWINEINYDEPGTDTGEFVEIAGIAGTDLSSLTLVEYNGNGGGTNGSLSLTGILGNTHAGYGFLSFLFPTNGLQNDDEGLALVEGSTVIQFLSYEGSFQATNGPANGQTSADIGVSETNSTPAGFTLQFLGHADNGSWTGPIASTSGSINTGQVLPDLSANNPSDSTPVPNSGATLGLLGLGLAAIVTLKRRKP